MSLAYQKILKFGKILLFRSDLEDAARSDRRVRRSILETVLKLFCGQFSANLIELELPIFEFFGDYGLSFF